MLWPVLLPLALLLRITLVVLKPLVHIRFGRIWVFHMGNHAICTEVYLCQSDAGELPKRSFDIFYPYTYEVLIRGMIKPKTVPANEQLHLMFKRHLRTTESARALDHLNRMIPWRSQEFCVDGADPYDRFGHLERFPTHLSFTPEEEERGREEMKKMGADPDAPFVCFYARDGLFLREIFPRITSVFGEYTLSDHRNSSINNYLPVAEMLTDLGYYAIRMGKNVEKVITPPNPKVVDYGAKFHSDFMDLYLSARCTYFVGNDGGMLCLPFIFRKPVVTVNAWPPGSIEGCLYHEGISIPKTIYSKEKGDILTLRETLESDFALNGFPTIEDIEALEGKGLKLLENTPEEITEAAMEMQQRIQSTFEPSEEDEDLQRRWMSIVMDYPQVIPIEPGQERRYQIGASFLRNHKGWLE